MLIVYLNHKTFRFYFPIAFPTFLVESLKLMKKVHDETSWDLERFRGSSPNEPSAVNAFLG